VQLRERQNLPFKCETCSLVAECGGGCPLTFENHREKYGVNSEIVPLSVLN